MAIPNVLPFPIRSVPTWAITNADDFFSLPLMGQFEPGIVRSDGAPIWVKKPGIFGGKAWIKYIGHRVSTLKFNFHCISRDILDQYPASALVKLNELAAVDSSLGRPPRIYFAYGTTVVEGFITDIPEIPVKYWENGGFVSSRLVREVGPVQVTITHIPKTEIEISLFTNFVVFTEDASYEEIAKRQYGDPRYAQSLAVYNQGAVRGDTIEVPRKSNDVITKVVRIAPFLDDAIEGL